jgi:cell division protein FtsQ
MKRETAVLPLDIRLMRVTANLLYLLCALALLALAVQWLANRGAFSIRTLHVSGALDHINPVTLRAQALSRLGGTFFTLDVASARQTFEQLPWVRRATVRRVWPNGLAVDIHEHRPAALWGREGSEKLLNTFGEVFEANIDEIEDDLPRLVGPQGSAPRVLAMYRQLSQRLAPTQDRIAVLSLDARQEWRAELDSGLSLLLGRDDDGFWQRLDQYLITAAQARSQTQRLYGTQNWARVDLRHAQGYAVALRRTAEGAAGDSTANGD